MQPTTPDYKKILTEILHKQILILGGQLTLMKARKVEGLTIDDTGTVTNATGDLPTVTTHFLNEFRDLSKNLVQATMQPLLELEKKEEPVVVPTDQKLKIYNSDDVTNRHLV